MSKARTGRAEIAFSRTSIPVILTYLTTNSQYREKQSIKNAKALNKATWASVDTQKSI